MNHTCTVIEGSEELLRAVVRELAGFGEITYGVCLDGRATYGHQIEVAESQRFLTASLGALAGRYGYVLFHKDDEYKLLKAAPERFMAGGRLHQ